MYILKIILFILLIIIGTIIALGVLFALFAIISSLFIDSSKEYTKDSKFYRGLLNTWTVFSMWLIRIHIKTTGLEKIPEGPVLVVGNHRSNFDPIITWFTLRTKTMSFISKEENFKIFTFGKVAKRCCFLAIDREDPRKAITTILKAASLVKEEKMSIGIYPEGTRNKTNEPLLPFHNGVFKIAQRAEIPIVVVTTNKTDEIHKNFPLHRSYINFDVVSVIPAEEIKGVTTNIIGDRVKEDMLKQLEKYNHE